MNRKCPDQGTLLAFADRELDQAARQKIEQHIGACSLCQTSLQQLLSDKAMVFARLSSLTPAPTQVPVWPKVKPQRFDRDSASTLEQIFSVIKNNFKPALAIMGMVLVAFIIKESITTKTDYSRYASQHYAMDSLSVRHSPHDSSVYAQWLKSVDDTTLIKLLLKSKGDATVVHL